MKKRRRKNRIKQPLPPPPPAVNTERSLGDMLIEELCHHIGEHGGDESPDLVLTRIIYERNTAFKLLALDRIRQFNESLPCLPMTIRRG